MIPIFKNTLAYCQVTSETDPSTQCNPTNPSQFDRTGAETTLTHLPHASLSPAQYKNKELRDIHSIDICIL